MGWLYLMPQTTAALYVVEEVVAELDHVRSVVVAVDALVVIINLQHQQNNK